LKFRKRPINPENKGKFAVPLNQASILNNIRNVDCQSPTNELLEIF